jgi:hypothetical protein
MTHDAAIGIMPGLFIAEPQALVFGLLAPA